MPEPAASRARDRITDQNVVPKTPLPLTKEIMLLSELTLRRQYRSDEHIIARDLYEQCLPVSKAFRRAVGFFSSGALFTCPAAFHAFFAGGGHIQLVCSPVLPQEDVEDIIHGYRDSPTLVRTEKLSNFLQPPAQLARSKRDILAWLVASRRLDIRIAIPDQSSSLYHEKLGIFEDADGHSVAFAGSANESRGGLRQNFEVVDVFRSWESSEQRRVLQKVSDFDTLWRDETTNVRVFGFPEAARLGLLRPVVAQDIEDSLNHETTVPEMSVTSPNLAISGVEETLGRPADLTLHPHQKQAIKEWLTADGHGILEMATGSGKTVTALAAAATLYNAIGPPLVIIIVCPYLHLVTQWTEQARRFGLDPVTCAVGRHHWREDLAVNIYAANVGTRRLTSVITTNTTFGSAAFQELLRGITVPTLLIADEVHNLGAQRLREGLPDSVQYRIGLSATPERWFDPEGTTALVKYFGPTLIHYTLEKALADGVLTPYQYFPLLVELTETETDEYYSLTVEIAREAGGIRDECASPRLEALLIKRARIVATAHHKLDTLRSVMVPLRSSTHNLIYCGDGSVETAPAERIEKQVEAVTRMLGRDLQMNAAKYTAETSLDRRSHLRKLFITGELQCLVAIRCLDEGVDIPETKRAFILASSTNPRQFIQRRGRVLRKSPGKEIADIYDFLVEPPRDLMDTSSPYFAVTRQLFAKELGRAITFCSPAVNGPEALGRLLAVRKRLNLLDLG